MRERKQVFSIRIDGCDFASVVFRIRECEKLKHLFNYYCYGYVHIHNMSYFQCYINYEVVWSVVQLNSIISRKWILSFSHRRCEKLIFFASRMRKTMDAKSHPSRCEIVKAWTLRCCALIRLPAGAGERRVEDCQPDWQCGRRIQS